MSAPKLVELDDGLHVFTSSTIDARFLYDEIFREGCYDDIGLPARSLVIDVGANIGMFALFVKLRYPDAEVLAFEPAPESAAVLRQNISLHHLDGVLVNEIALGAVRERAAPFTYYPAIPANSTRYPQEKELQKRVMARTYTAKAVERLHTGRLITVAVDRLSRFLPAEALQIPARRPAGRLAQGRCRGRRTGRAPRHRPATLAADQAGDPGGPRLQWPAGRHL